MELENLPQPKKHQAIVNALEARDVWKLKELALSPGGLLNDKFRREAWPLIVRSGSVASTSTKTTTTTTTTNSPWDHPSAFLMATGCCTATDLALMELDVARGTRHYLHSTFSSSSSTATTSARRMRLLHCLQQSIPDSMRYFQGLHHVASVILDTMEDAGDVVTVASERNKEQETIRESQWKLQKEIDDEDLDDSMLEEKKVDDSLCSADDSLILQFQEAPPLLVFDRAIPPASSYRRAASSSAAPSSPPTIQRHFDLTTTPALESTVEILHRLALSHLTDSMSGDDLLPLQTALRLTIVPFLAYFDPALHERLWNCGLVGHPDDTGGECSYSFCLPWILTWFSHDPCLTSETVKRLFDAFMSAHPLLPVYTAIAILLQHRQQIMTLKLLHDDDDAWRLHELLVQLPRHVSNWDAVLQTAIGLMRRLPPRNVLRLAEQYYGRNQVLTWMDKNYQTPSPRMLLFPESASLRVPWWGNKIVKSAAGLGEGDVAMRKAGRRRRRVFAVVLLMLVVAVSWTSWPFRSAEPTQAPHSNVESAVDYKQCQSSADGLDAYDGFPLNNIVADIEKRPEAWRATLRPRVIAMAFLALYLRNFLLVSSGSMERLDAHLLQQYQVDDGAYLSSCLNITPP